MICYLSHALPLSYTQSFLWLGGTVCNRNCPIRVNIRIIAARNRDLEKAMQSGGFRSDLDYRLNVIRLGVPALWDRRSYIPEMVVAFLKAISEADGKAYPIRFGGTMRLLVDYSWPGNIQPSAVPTLT